MIFEILVPKSRNNGLKYDESFHKLWDIKIREITGGLTVQRASKGSWIKKNGELIIEEMIPVKIFCTDQQFQEILQLTLEHYSDQEKIMGYKISNEVFFLNRKGE